MEEPNLVATIPRQHGEYDKKTGKPWRKRIAWYLNTKDGCDGRIGRTRSSDKTGSRRYARGTDGDPAPGEEVKQVL